MAITVKQAIQSGQMLDGVIENWRLDTELLLAHVLGKTREFLFTWPDFAISDDAAQCLASLLDRRAKGEPLAYLTGKRFFWDFELTVNPSVLIPRPETELLVEKAIELGEKLNRKSLRLADLGTGSGAIAIALARYKACWQVMAVDKSSDALDVARGNSEVLGVSTIQFLQGSWCDSLPDQSVDLLIANPPYVEPGDPHLGEGSLPFEPLMALVAEDQGFADIQQIINQGKRCLQSGGWLLLEHGYDQSVAVTQRLAHAGYTHVGTQADLAGIERIAFGQWFSG